MGGKEGKRGEERRRGERGEVRREKRRGKSVGDNIL